MCPPTRAWSASRWLATAPSGARSSHADDVPAGLHPIPDGASAAGCGWPAATTIPVGRDWPSGYYAVTVTAGAERADAFLVVHPVPGAAGRSPILLVLSTCTWNAYNDWGGPCLYTGATQVAFERPLARGFLVKPEPHRRKAQPQLDREALYFFEWAEPRGLSVWSGGAGWWNWERTFLRWAEANGFAVDVAIQQDLEDVPGLLDGARLYLSVGHDEYWTWGMRDAVDRHTAAGGNAAIFSGNTCYWQVRISEDRRTMTGYKYGADADPVLGTEDERFLTGAWVDRTDRPAGDVRRSGSRSRAAAIRATASASRGHRAPTPSGDRTIGCSRGPTSPTATPSVSPTRSSATRSTAAT